MDKYVCQRFIEALERCKSNLDEMKAEMDDKTFMVGYEMGAIMVLDEIKNILETYVK